MTRDKAITLSMQDDGLTDEERARIEQAGPDDSAPPSVDLDAWRERQISTAEGEVRNRVDRLSLIREA